MQKSSPIDEQTRLERRKVQNRQAAASLRARKRNYTNFIIARLHELESENTFLKNYIITYFHLPPPLLPFPVTDSSQEPLPLKLPELESCPLVIPVPIKPNQ